MFVALVCFALFAPSHAQVGGGSVYQNQSAKDRAEANERAKRNISKEDMPPNGTGYFVDASVMMNVVADQYVAVFGLSEEGTTLGDARQKINAKIAQFSGELKKLGVNDKSMFVDFVAQNRIYGYVVEGEFAKEQLVGFEIKSNLSVHYSSRTFLDKAIAFAAQAEIFDLVKVDYIVTNTAAVQNRLMDEAARVLRQKASNHQKLLGAKFKPSVQVYAEKYGSYYPTDMYDSYTAFEAEDVSSNYNRQKFIVQGARKNRTFYFNALDASSFDKVINPAVIEPVVQFTLYVKVKYELAQTPVAKATKAKKR